MAGDLPEYYFRVRENGAFVFRVDTENRQRRIDMDQIAVVNIRKGEIKPHGDRELSEADMAAITDWMDRAAGNPRAPRYRRHPAHGGSPQHHRPMGAVARHRRAARPGDRCAAAGDARPAHGAGAQKGRPGAEGQVRGARTARPKRNFQKNPVRKFQIFLAETPFFDDPELSGVDGSSRPRRDMRLHPAHRPAPEAHQHEYPASASPTAMPSQTPAPP